MEVVKLFRIDFARKKSQKWKNKKQSSKLPCSVLLWRKQKYFNCPNKIAVNGTELQKEDKIAAK